MMVSPAFFGPGEMRRQPATQLQWQQKHPFHGHERRGNAGSVAAGGSGRRRKDRVAGFGYYSRMRQKPQTLNAPEVSRAHRPGNRPSGGWSYKN